MTPSPVEIQYYIKKAQQSRLTQSEVDGLIAVAKLYLAKIDNSHTCPLCNRPEMEHRVVCPGKALGDETL